MVVEVLQVTVLAWNWQFSEVDFAKREHLLDSLQLVDLACHKRGEKISAERAPLPALDVVEHQHAGDLRHDAEDVIAIEVRHSMD